MVTTKALGKTNKMAVTPTIPRRLMEKNRKRKEIQQFSLPSEFLALPSAALLWQFRPGLHS